MNGYDEWRTSLSAAERVLVATEIVNLQRKLVFLTLGAAVELAPGRVRRISGVVLLTPVDTGRTRSSWSVARGAPSTSPTGNASAAAGVVSSLGVYETVWITSSVPWIKVLEYGGYPNPPRHGSWDRHTRSWVIKSAGGFSRQAPRGMVRITVEGVLAAVQGMGTGG